MKALTALLSLVFASQIFADNPAKPWWSPSVDTALSSAGENRGELTKALTGVPESQREGMKFLIENMPQQDLRGLKADFLLSNTAFAYETFNAAPWAKQVPQDVFLNDVLPYASLNETRDDWRKRLYDIAAPLIKDCKTSGEAAHTLNKKLFGIVKVGYNTKRKKPDQSPIESMESGMATCTGLSILLVDACRAVGIPARVAGTPMWTNMRGNHTWVEVWDNGWHFAGAAEPDGKGLDRGWFCGDASKALKDVAQHAIYASSFKKTKISFPLEWAPWIQWVSAENVTDRYATPTATAPPADKVRLLVRVLDHEGGKRIAAKVTLTDPADTSVKLEGTSRDESADLNNILPFTVIRGKDFKLAVESNGKTVERSIKTTADKSAEQTVTVSAN